MARAALCYVAQGTAAQASLAATSHYSVGSGQCAAPGGFHVGAGRRELHRPRNHRWSKVAKADRPITDALGRGVAGGDKPFFRPVAFSPCACRSGAVVPGFLQCCEVVATSGGRRGVLDVPALRCPARADANANSYSDSRPSTPGRARRSFLLQFQGRQRTGSSRRVCVLPQL
jgi:hypothetical protein